MEARKRAMQKRKKLRTLGKSRSTESEDEENEEEEGKQINIEKGTPQLYIPAQSISDYWLTAITKSQEAPSLHHVTTTRGPK